MTVEETVYAALSGDPALSALVGTRIYPVTLPQDCIYPAVVYQRIQTDRYMTLCGPSGSAQAVVQTVSLSQTYAESREVATAARGAMAAIPGCLVGSDADDHDEDMDLHLVTADFSIFHNED